MSNVVVQFKRTWEHNLPLPKYETEGAAGFDLRTAEEHYPLQPGETKIFSTGFAVAIPRGYEGQVRSRSGLACKHSIIVTNSPGTIDSDYRGELKVSLTNLGKNEFVVAPETRIAQMVIAPVAQAEIIEVSDLSKTERNTGGFGSTGLT